MESIDWKQPASLRRANGLEMTEGRRRELTIPIALGPLDKMLETYLEQLDNVRPYCRLYVAGGFHLDGNEIDDLLCLR